MLVPDFAIETDRNFLTHQDFEAPAIVINLVEQMVENFVVLVNTS